MNRTRRNFLIIIGLAVAGVLAMANWPPYAPPIEKIELVRPGSVLVMISSSVTKQKWMEAVMEKFESEEITTANGKKIIVRTTGVLSGGSMWDILAGKLKPVAWSPGAVSWVEQFRERWAQDGNRSAGLGPLRSSRMGKPETRPSASEIFQRRHAVHDLLRLWRERQNRRPDHGRYLYAGG
jgi:hypothetical protein